ncbi:HAMP domain-containing sensor histidine kinase [Methylocella sp. CPCC 101449]|uniref:sensor histidine kinase n=1 Tax=Methylocella sp. CPCC 101449 TaxID=2987531 RepID=UPI0028915C52|nr:HAMP domain-containing sensor histidine kinase [Methylocella sp. CPCC 101449]MDT2019246.1 HAMP domain-containing histidine kinase [Methylocella sp. CPCC 101449]
MDAKVGPGAATETLPLEAPLARERRRTVRVGLISRVLLGTLAFILLVQVVVFVPWMATFRNYRLRDQLSAAYIAALVLDAAPDEMVPEPLKNDLLTSVGAQSIALKLPSSRRLLASTDMPPSVDERYDLRTATPIESMMSALRTLFGHQGRTISVVGDAPMGAEYIDITIDETALRNAMWTRSINVLLVSLTLSVLLAALAVATLHIFVLRPVRRLTDNLKRFGEDPEDPTRIIEPSGRLHEIGDAETALASMQTTLVDELRQKKHLAALGLAVAKINHDLRNMLSTAQLLSDRLATSSDPLVRSIGPKLIATLDRAISYCQSTLTYGRAVESAPQFGQLGLRALVDEAFETVAPHSHQRVALENSVDGNAKIVADGEQMLRVLLNMCRNSIEALEAAGAFNGEDPRVTVTSRREDNKIIIEITDNGPGVPARARAAMFEAFRGSARSGGTGLGLAIAAEIVHAHGGDIILLPQDDGPGATFRIMLPPRGI